MTLWRAAASLAAPQSRDENVPVMILTPSRVISRFASLAAAVGSGASAATNTSFLPMTPPRSLIMSRTISYPSRCRLPSPASGPVSGSSTPILYSPESDKFEHADLVLARERLAVDACEGGAEDDGQRGHDGNDGPAVHTRPPDE